MTLPPLTLPRAVLGRIVAVLDAPTNSFVALANIAGLDPKSDFRGADLTGVDFGTDDLSDFDFSGADLTDAHLSRAAGRDRMKTDAATRLPANMRRPPPDFDLDKARDMILSGKAPPVAARAFIHRLDFSDTSLDRLEPLSGLTALQSLVLNGMPASDVSPLSGLIALLSLSLMRTPVGDVSPLSDLTALRTLDLRYTPVSDVSPLSGLSALQTLDLRDTPVSDVSMLAHIRGLAIQRDDNR